MKITAAAAQSALNTLADLTDAVSDGMIGTAEYTKLATPLRARIAAGVAAGLLPAYMAGGIA